MVLESSGLPVPSAISGDKTTAKWACRTTKTQWFYCRATMGSKKPVCKMFLSENYVASVKD